MLCQKDDDTLLKALLNLVPPPDCPVNTGSVAEWHSITADLAQEFPQELFLLNSAYGSGHFVQEEFSIEIHSVFRPAFTLMVDFNRRVFAQEAIRHPNPYSNMFELGAYAWGDDQGSMGRLFWDTSGTMDDWMIGLSRPLQRYSTSLLEFLVKCFSNEMHPTGFPEKFTSVRFVPWERPSLID